MKWYHYIACLFAGFFLANAIPHFVQGVSGDNFPSPFSNPPGKGPSSPTVNVLWALFNIIIGYLLYKGGKVATGKWALLVFFIGFAAAGIMLSITFTDKLSQ